MHPYRPLYVTSRTKAPAKPPLELRGLAIVLVLLAAIRLLPVLATHEAFGAEATVAMAMLSLGFLELSSVSRRVRRWRRRRMQRRA
jgi:hypothetical protein